MLWKLFGLDPGRILRASQHYGQVPSRYEWPNLQHPRRIVLVHSSRTAGQRRAALKTHGPENLMREAFASCSAFLGTWQRFIAAETPWRSRASTRFRRNLVFPSCDEAHRKVETRLGGRWGRRDRRRYLDAVAGEAVACFSVRAVKIGSIPQSAAAPMTTRPGPRLVWEVK
jgi:hypothetical protein